uniref:Uncharacterized protein n=1 Tax=Rhizophora mucronata TaxID=61149 RepID=A0A2P2NAL4_RHIMU
MEGKKQSNGRGFKGYVNASFSFLF